MALLLKLVTHGDLCQLTRLIGRGISNINEPSFGVPLLGQATAAKLRWPVTCCLGCSGEPGQARHDGATPCVPHTATQRWFSCCLSADASTDTTMHSGVTPLMYAAQGNHRSKVRMLLQQGVLHLADSHGHQGHRVAR